MANLAVYLFMDRGAALAAKSPLPPSLQKMQPPCPIVPSRLGQLMPPFKGDFINLFPEALL